MYFSYHIMSREWVAVQSNAFSFGKAYMHFDAFTPSVHTKTLSVFNKKRTVLKTLSKVDTNKIAYKSELLWAVENESIWKRWRHPHHLSRTQASHPLEIKRGGWKNTFPMLQAYFVASGFELKLFLFNLILFFHRSRTSVVRALALWRFPIIVQKHHIEEQQAIFDASQSEVIYSFETRTGGKCRKYHSRPSGKMSARARHAWAILLGKMAAFLKLDKVVAFRKGAFKLPSSHILFNKENIVVTGVNLAIEV